MSVDQAQKLLRAAAEQRPNGDPYPLHDFVVLLLTSGLRPEEARALRWLHAVGFPDVAAVVALRDGYDHGQYGCLLSRWDRDAGLTMACTRRKRRRCAGNHVDLDAWMVAVRRSDRAGS